MTSEERIERLERAVACMARELARHRGGALEWDVYKAVATFAEGGAAAEARANELRAYAKSRRESAKKLRSGEQAPTHGRAAKKGENPAMTAYYNYVAAEEQAGWDDHHAGEAERLAAVYDGKANP